MTIRSLSELLNDLKAQLTGEKTRLSELLTAFHERGFGFFLFLFALPAALPLPGLGVNTVIALPLLLLTAQIAIGRENVWMPYFIRSQELSTAKMNGFIDKATPYLQKIEKLVRPRVEFITQKPMANIIGFLAFIMAIAVAIPLPLTTTVPSFGLALIGIGLMMRDGLVIITGTLIGICWVALLAGLIIFIGMEGIDLFKDVIKGVLG